MDGLQHHAIGLAALERYEEPGLYLLFDDGSELTLTAKEIKATAKRFLADPELLTPDMRRAAHYSPCEICPEKHSAKICHAILPYLPFIESTEHYLSHESVVAAWRAPGDEPLSLMRTDLQQALKYVAMLSLMSYCETGRQYEAYFREVNPLLPPEQIAEAVFRRLHVATAGNLTEMRQVVKRMALELLTTSRCQTRRIALISSSDAFLNAFVNVQTATELLLLDIQSQLEQLEAENP